ncbi:MAG: hypothetical protein QGG42_20095 [Phycisphaerae bacterium]|nr:hypothetical protein [Phycisphaerae bacterium]
MLIRNSIPLTFWVTLVGSTWRFSRNIVTVSRLVVKVACALTGCSFISESSGVVKVIMLACAWDAANATTRIDMVATYFMVLVLNYGCLGVLPTANPVRRFTTSRLRARYRPG